MAKFGRKRPRGAGDDGGDPVAVNQRVRVFLPTDADADADAEAHGLVVDDFGQQAGLGVDVLESHFADAARRWAVLLDDGTLVFVDDHQLAPE